MYAVNIRFIWMEEWKSRKIKKLSEDGKVGG